MLIDLIAFFFDSATVELLTSYHNPVFFCGVRHFMFWRPKIPSICIIFSSLNLNKCEIWNKYRFHELNVTSSQVKTTHTLKNKATQNTLLKPLAKQQHAPLKTTWDEFGGLPKGSTSAIFLIASKIWWQVFFDNITIEKQWTGWWLRQVEHICYSCDIYFPYICITVIWTFKH